MLTEKFGIKTTDVQGEIDDLHKQYLANHRILKSQLRHLKDLKACQGSLVPAGALADGVTIESTEAQIKTLRDLNGLRARHLNALLRVLLDELAEVADAMQTKLPLDASNEEVAA
jgi:hypothetical protein